MATARFGQKLPDDPAELDGITKSAILLLSIQQDAASKVLGCLPEENVTDVARVMASLGAIPAALRDAVVEEFYGLALAQQQMQEGGLDSAKALLLKSLDGKTADKIISQIQTHVQKTPFAFLQKAETANILAFISEEHPQTIALIVSHLPHHKAAEILVGLNPQKQVEVVKRIANMEQTNPEVIRSVERTLEGRLSNMLSQSMERTGGVDTVAEILNLADRTTEKSIMEGLESEDPTLVEQIRRLMFVFEDIIQVDDKGIQRVLKEIDNDELSLALKTASKDLQEKVFRNMSERAATLIREDMQFMGPVRVSDVESAQQRIVDIVRRLEDAGDIVIAGRGADKDMVV